MESISPHTTACRYILRLFGPVRYPSLPATNSLQSRAISRRIPPASCVCGGVRPNVRQYPTRRLTSESQRGLREAVAATWELSCAGGVDFHLRVGWLEGLVGREEGMLLLKTMRGSAWFAWPGIGYDRREIMFKRA